MDRYGTGPPRHRYGLELVDVSGTLHALGLQGVLRRRRPVGREVHRHPGGNEALRQTCASNPAGMCSGEAQAAGARCCFHSASLRGWP